MNDKFQAFINECEQKFISINIKGREILLERKLPWTLNVKYLHLVKRIENMENMSDNEKLDVMLEMDTLFRQFLGAKNYHLCEQMRLDNQEIFDIISNAIELINGNEPNYLKRDLILKVDEDGCVDVYVDEKKSQTH